MSEDAKSSDSIELRPIVVTTAVVLGMMAAAAVAYLLLDILLLLFMGIVVAAALQPWHVVLCRWGIPKGLAVLLIYLCLLIGLVLIALILGPVLLEQVGTFVAEVPGTYADARAYLRASETASLQFLGQRLPPFERLTQDLAGLAPHFYESTIGVTTSIVTLPAYFLTVLAIGFYWTMEVPRFERLFLSLLPVDQRPRALNIWHEIESKLGGFIRGQGLAMFAIGAASAVGYAVIGLPNVLVLAVLAGLLEAVPLVGPILAVVPAVLVALPLGPQTVFLVIGLAVLLQVIENNVLVPRIMQHAVGVSALVGLLAILAFGTLYGILGVLIAIPMTAVIQVLLDTMVINAEPVAEPAGLDGSPWEDIRARIRMLRQQARVRLRARTSRMGIDPATVDHAVDAVDQQIEVAVERVEQLIAAAEKTAAPLATEAQAAIIEKLHGATEEIKQAVERADTLATPVADTPATSATTVAQALAEPRQAKAQGKKAVEQVADPEGIVDNLDQATQRFKEAVQDVETLVVAAQEESREVAPEPAIRPKRD